MELTHLEKEFIKIYGIGKFDEIQNYMINNDIYDVYLLKRQLHQRELLLFAIKFGIIEIAIITFCKSNIEFDLNKILCEFYHSDVSDTISDNNVPIVHNYANKDGWYIDLSWDKFSKNRQNVIAYLIKLKKFSKWNHKCGIDYYKFNNKYEKFYNIFI